MTPNNLTASVEVTVYHDDSVSAEQPHDGLHEVGFGDIVSLCIHGARAMHIPDEITTEPQEIYGLQVWRSKKALYIIKPRHAAPVDGRSAMFWFDLLSGVPVRVKRLEAAEHACAHAEEGRVDSTCARSVFLDLAAANHVMTQLFQLVHDRGGIMR